MDVYEAIEKRQTIREFEDRAVPDEIIEKILGAGLKAPTNDHLRRWEFVVVDDKKQREKLLRIHRMEDAGAIDGWLDSWGAADPAQREMYHAAVPRQFSMLYNAGALILPFFERGDSPWRPESISSLNAFASIWCCIENILIAAAAEGIHGVTRIPLGDEPAHVKKVLGHPDGYALPCFIALGYPAKSAKRTRQNAVSAKEKIHSNAW